MKEDSKPTTIPELSIHLGYIKVSLEEIKEQIRNVGNKFCTQEDFNDLKEEVKEHRINIDSLLGDRKYFLGALAVLVALQGGIIYFAKMYITNEINANVELSIEKVLSTYNIGINEINIKTK